MLLGVIQPTVRRHHHHRTLFNREGDVAPHCFVQAFTGLLPMVFMGSHSSRCALVGTRSSQVARQFLWEISSPLSPPPRATDLTQGLHGVQIGLHGWRARAPLSGSPHKNPMTRVYPFHVARHVRRARVSRVRKFRRINSPTRRLSDSRGASLNYLCSEGCVAIK